MSGVAEAVALVGVLVDLLQTVQRFAPALSGEIAAVSGLVRQAQAERRDLTGAELAAVRALAEAARERAARAVEAAPT